MTTAHRPTYTAARGHGDQGMNKFIGRSQQISALDAPHHLTMKERASGQNHPEDVNRKDLKAELIEREGKAGKAQPVPPQAMIEAPDEDDRISGDEKDFANLDKDDTDSGGDESDVSGEDDSDEETAELMRELEKIKKERAQEAELKAQEERVASEKAQAEAVRLGNPLIEEAPEAGAIKRRWDDDVVFKNQARSEPEQKKKRFVNDTIRSDFHRRFMNKYIK